MQQTFLVSEKTDKLHYAPDCTSANGQKDTAILHSVSQALFNRFKGGNNDTTKILASDIMTAINTPSTDYLKFHYDTATEQITYTLGVEPYPQPGADPDVEYSICLFKGIFMIDPTVSYFLFYPAQDWDREDIIIFASFDSNDAVLNYYDLSNTHP